MRFAFLFAFALAPAVAQTTNPAFVPGANAAVSIGLAAANPTSSSCDYTRMIYNYLTGHLYTCVGTPGAGNALPQWFDQGAASSPIRPIGASFDGQGSALSNGKTLYFTSPYACTIKSWYATVDTGTATFAVWKIVSGTAIPTSANSITASAAPAIASGTAANSSTLTGWSTAVAVGDIFGFSLTAVSNATLASIVLGCQ